MVIWAQAWISAGVGGALPYAYPAYSVSGSLKVKNFPVKLRLGGIWDGDAESLKEEAILFGHEIPTSSKIFYIGLSNINGHRRGALLPDPNPGSWLHTDKHEKVYYKSMGLTLELESLNQRGSLFKFGYTLMANLNKETPYVCALITLNIGSFLK